MFTGYVAASPAIGWDANVIYQYEKKFFESKNNLPARLFMTVGGVERGVPGFETFAELEDSRNYPNLHIRSKVLENTGHSGTKTETFSRGLQYIFERPTLQLDATVLNQYTGSYKTVNGFNVEIKTANNHLTLYFGPNNIYLLYAANETDFYSTNEFLNLHFTINNGKVEGFQLNRYGNSQFIKKNN
jgi:hypothetical protein